MCNLLVGIIGEQALRNSAGYSKHQPLYVLAVYWQNYLSPLILVENLE